MIRRASPLPTTGSRLCLIVIGQGVRALYRLARHHRAEVALRARTPTSRRLQYAESFLARGTPVLAAVSGRATRDVQLDFHALMFVVTRWATMDLDERRLVTGAEDEDEIDTIIEGHLSALTQRLFMPAEA